jgi:hypothetical protein
MPAAWIVAWFLTVHLASAQTNPPPPSDADERLREMERENRKLREDLDRLKEDHEFTKNRVDQVMPVTNRVGGYVDLGFFSVQGDGSGVRPDIDNRRFPEYADVPGTWVFMGDPLSTAVNARGEPADTGPSRAVTFNPIRNGGKPSFILNALNVGLFTGVGDDLTVHGLFDLVPRSRDVSDSGGVFLGDFVDVKLGYAEYHLAPGTLSVSAGKFDSVLGREYRTQESPDRLTVTPSLICRYTCGRPLGVKARLRLFEEALVLNTSVTNGTHSLEMFPFYNEIDVNKFKTAASRISYKFPGTARFDVGASGAFGAQDFQTDDAVTQWHYGFDAHFDWHDFDFAAEFVQGRAVGKTQPGESPCGLAACLEYKGAYSQLGYRVTNWLIPFARWDWREALHRSGASFVYVSNVMRGTFGARFELGTHVVIKAEYTLNRELGRLPQFADDVFSSALVVKY